MGIAAGSETLPQHEVTASSFRFRSAATSLFWRLSQAAVLFALDNLALARNSMLENELKAVILRAAEFVQEYRSFSL